MAARKTQDTLTDTLPPDGHRGEIIGLSIVALSLVLLVAMAVRPDGRVFSVLLDLLAIAEVYIGAGLYVVSLYLWYLGVERFRGRRVFETRLERTGALLLLPASLAAIAAIGGDGGILGESIARALAALLGGPGGFVATASLLLVAISFAFGVLLRHLFAALFSLALTLGRLALSAGGAAFAALRGLAARPPAPEEGAAAAEGGAEPKGMPAAPRKPKVTVYEGDIIEPKPIFVSADAPAEPAEPAKAGAAPAAGEKTAGLKEGAKGRAKAAEGRGGEPAPARAPRKAKTPPPPEGYALPPVDLMPRPDVPQESPEDDLREKSDRIVRTLRSFSVDATVTQITHGPSVTRFELVPASGVHVKKIVSLADDLALNLATSSIRIEAPIPGKSAVGIEVPNERPSTVFFADLIRQKEFGKKRTPLLIALGKTITGQPVIADLSVMPHLLIAGTTGSGKSVCMNTIIASILFRSTPEQVRMIMVDPKKVELSVYNDIPHLLHPVVTNPKKAQSALAWAVSEMERRYELLSHYNIRNIAGFNKLVADARAGAPPAPPEGASAADGPPDPGLQVELAAERELPYIVVIIDELADLMMTNASDKVEESICRLAQMARAIGIHLVVATQRPSVNVITGLIKANMPSRIAFMVSSITDSRTILDMKGAESLLGRGDMLYNPVGAPKPIRVQGAYVSDDEVNTLVRWIKERYASDYEDHVAEAIELTEGDAADDGPIDPMIGEAIRITVNNKSGSTSMLQRILKVGHNRALEMMAQMERLGVVGPFEDKKPRRVIWTPDEVEIRLKDLAI